MPKLLDARTAVADQVAPEVRQLMEHLIAEAQWHTQGRLDEEERVRRTDVETLNRKHAAVLEEMRAKMNEVEFRIQQQEDGLEVESSLRKDLKAEILESVAAPPQEPPHLPGSVPSASVALENMPLLQGIQEKLESLQAGLLEVQCDNDRLRSDLVCKARSLHEYQQKHEEYVDRLQKIDAWINTSHSLLELKATRSEEEPEKSKSSAPEQQSGQHFLSPTLLCSQPRAQEKAPGVQCAAEAQQEESVGIRVLEADLVAKGEPCSPTGLVTGSEGEQAIELALATEYKFQTSTWDACIFCGLRPVSLADSVLTCVACFTAFSLQAVFISIIFASLVGDPFTDERLIELKNWRVFKAHRAEYYDELSQTSLAARVCGGSFSLSMAEQQNLLYDSVRTFLQSDFTLDGRTLCTVCLILWTLSIIQELKSTARLFGVLWRSTTLQPTQLAAEGDGIKLGPLHRVRSALLTAFVVFPRCGIAAFLFVAGVQFLMFSVDIGELLLNALALTFILSIDEMVYEVLVPAVVKLMQERMVPVKLGTLKQRYMGCKAVDMLTLCSMALLIGTILIVVQYGLGDFLDRAGAARDILCKGDLNFVYTTDKGSGIIYLAETSNTDLASSPRRLGGASSYAEAAVLNRTNLTSYLGQNMVDDLSVPATDEHDVYYLEEPRVDQVLNLDSMSQQESNNLHPCQDALPREPRMLAASTALTFYTGLAPASTCANLTEHCHGPYHDKVRGLCPQTCGCGDPVQGTFDLKGCTSNCGPHRSHKVTALAKKLGCQDLAVAQLASVAVWTKFWVEAQEYMERHGMLEDLLEQLNITDLVAAAADGGCEFATSLQEASSIDPCCHRGSCRFGTIAMYCGQTCGVTCRATGKQTK